VSKQNSRIFNNEITADVNRLETLGTDLYNAYKSQRLANEGTACIWDPIKRNKLKLRSTNNKKVKIEIAGTVTELTNDRSLFARLMIVTRSKRDLDLREILGKYELCAVPRSLFTNDSIMHQCPMKSKLIHILQSLAVNNEEEQLPSPVLGAGFTVAVVDGMAELQALVKPSFVRNVSDLATIFVQRIERKYRQYDDFHIVFDSYQQQSIKNITRDKRLHGTAATKYKIYDNTDISAVSMKKLLSHIDTKDHLTEYLSKKLLEHARTWHQTCIVAWRSEAASTHGDFSCLKSTHEEADTKMILHSINACDRGAKKLLVFAQDTDVLVLLVRRYPRLPGESFFVPATGRHISISEIYKSLGELKASALPRFHAFSGCDTTGCVKGKGKLSYWQIFQSIGENALVALSELGRNDTVTDEIINHLEEFI